MSALADKELQEYRGLLEPPEHFDDGFNWKTVVGALFLGFIMMPGTMYLGLVIGADGGIGQAARWVTIILFAEVARRSFKDLKMQEIYILFYMAGVAMGSPFEGILWRQYFVQADFSRAMGIAQEVPWWWSPSAEQIREGGRNIFTMAWLGPIALMIFGLVVNRLDNYGLGYVLYRIANDVEELPFPMAPVGASGILALANTRDEKQKWRWRCFSIGGMLGMAFGILYVGVPIITGALLPKPIQIIPIPWLDLTPGFGNMEIGGYRAFAAFPFNLTFDLTFVIVGMVIPFWAVIGGVAGVIITAIVNPLLYQAGILTKWEPGTGFVDTMYLNSVDFYLSFGVGLTLAVTVVSMATIVKPLFQFVFTKPKAADTATPSRGLKEGWRILMTNSPKRGDFSIWIALCLYLFSSFSWIGLAVLLVPGFPWPFFVFYALVYTPLISYATAKLEGLCGQAIDIPMIRQVTYIISGYQGVDIWFAHVPIQNLGVETVGFRVLELTGTKIKSQIKALVVTTPIVAISSLIFSQLLWSMAEVPSDDYPYAQQMWELQLKQQCLTMSATLEGGSEFMEAWDWGYFNWGLGSGVVTFVLLSMAGLPTLLVFGVVRGLGQSSPGGLVLELIGALIGRYYFRKRFGNMWMKYAPVILAGFTCGMGLLTLVVLAFRIWWNMIKPLDY